MKISFNTLSFEQKISDIPNQKKIRLQDCNLKGYTAFVNGDVYKSDNKISSADLLFKDNKLIAVNVCDDDISSANVVDVKDKYITPAIIDQHIHGGLGCDFNTGDEKQIRNLLKELKKCGYSELLATFIPDTISTINKQTDLINKIIESPNDDEARIIGINLEGPFFNKNKKGIHNECLIMPPSVKKFKQINLKNVKMVTLAPELDKDYALTKYLNKNGIIASAGHSTASSEDIKKSGVKQITHLFNAMPQLESRRDGMLKEGLINDSITVEIIPDLNHLSADTVNLTMKVKPDDKVVFVSDALKETHTDKNSFFMQGLKIVKDKDGFAAHKDKDGNITIAGSLMFLSDSAKKLVQKTNIGFEKFIRCASVNPALNLGRAKHYVLEENATPNFVVWDKDKIIPEKTFIANA